MKEVRRRPMSRTCVTHLCAHIRVIEIGCSPTVRRLDGRQRVSRACTPVVVLHAPRPAAAERLHAREPLRAHGRFFVRVRRHQAEACAGRHMRGPTRSATVEDTDRWPFADPETASWSGRHDTGPPVRLHHSAQLPPFPPSPLIANRPCTCGSFSACGTVGLQRLAPALDRTPSSAAGARPTSRAAGLAAPPVGPSPCAQCAASKASAHGCGTIAVRSLPSRVLPSEAACPWTSAHRWQVAT